MYFYQYALLAGFTCLLFSNSTRFASFVFICGWVVYLIATDSNYPATYYAISATIEAAIAYALNHRFRVVSWLGYSLILVNAYGLLLFKINAEPWSYDLIYALVAITQFLFLLARAMPNGIHRLPFKRFMVRAVSLDSCGAYDRMHKNKKSKGAYK